MSSDGILNFGGSNSELFPGDKYISRRATDKARKEKKKKKKEKRDSNSNGTGLNGGSMSYGGTNGGTTRAQADFMDTPDFYDNNELENYAESKYIRKPEPDPAEEQAEQAQLLSSTDNVDPDDPLAAEGGGFHDEFEDELHEIEMREDKQRNYNSFGETAISKWDRRKRCCKIYLLPLFLVLLFCIGIAMTVLYWIGYGKVESSNSSRNKIAQAVPAAPFSLSDRCAGSTVSPSENGDPFAQVPQFCKDTCARAECCWNPGGGYRCTDDTKDRCADYEQPCATLARLDEEFVNVDGTEEMVVQPMQDALRDACMPSAFEVTTACRVGCSKAECCWKPQSSFICTEDSVDYCDEYKEVCDVIVAEDQSNNDNDQGLDGAPPPAPNGLRVYCAPDEMEEISLHICQDKCSQAACCWDTDVDSCADEYSDVCDDYAQSCDILNQLATAPGNSNDVTAPTQSPVSSSTAAPIITNDQIPVAPVDLATRCSPDNILNAENGGEALIECEEDCLSAACCWQPNLQSCAFNSRCDDYQQHCQMFVSMFNEVEDEQATGNGSGGSTGSGSLPDFIPNAPNDMNLRCSEQNIEQNPNGRAFCEESCAEAECCWNDVVPSCQEKFPGQCSGYGLCVNLLTNLPSPPTSPPTKAPAKPVLDNVPMATEDLALFCNKDVLNPTTDNGEFIVRCEEECLKAACCWKANDQFICPDAPQCEAYMEPCGENLVSALEALDTNGNGSNTGSDSSGSSGGTSGTTVERPPPTSPPTKAPAKPVLDNVPMATEDLALFCNKDVLDPSTDNGEFIVRCEEECLKAACCWKANDQFICPDGPQCEAYMEPCGENLVAALEALDTNGNDSNTGSDSSGSSGGTSGTTVEPPPDDLSNICAAGMLIDLQDMQICKQACLKGDCCWLNPNHSESCSAATDCQIYRNDCALLREELEITVGSFNDAISSACDTNDPGYTQSRCEDVCSAGICCYDDALSCPTTLDIDCMPYAPCDVLTRRNMLRHR